ncbi:carboxypeptidase-like regulatory domain-containing protein [Tunturiibacter psychrotolerans]|uniref:carboxypeptidase-like regulatory domain-containing protein n=1 Tax=Tunturiibacter psychrotolerans TaxID=3069686 RepID=UPI003D21BB1A
MHSPFLSLLALPVPILVILSSALLLPLVPSLPWCALFLSFRSATVESVVPHLASSHSVHSSLYRLCLALAILVSIPSPTIKRRSNLWIILGLPTLAFLLSLGAAPSTSAQNLSPSIRGTVDSPEGSTINGAKVVLTNQRTEAIFRTRTNCKGTYEFRQLPVGTYSLSVQAPGFQTFTVYGIDLTPDSDYTRQIDMLRGSMTRAILVPATTPQGTQVVRLLPPSQP